jgi:hypothetical protein
MKNKDNKGYKMHSVDDVLAAGGIEKYTKKMKIKTSTLLMTTSILLTKKEDEAMTKILKKD